GSYSTSFTNAYYNGFKPNLGSINLASNYRVSWWYKPTTSHSDNFNDNVPDYSYRQFSYHPAQEFSATATITNNNSTVTAKTAEGVTISIRRSTSTNCTATATGHTNLTCVRTNTNRYTA